MSFTALYKLLVPFVAHDTTATQRWREGHKSESPFPERGQKTAREEEALLKREKLSAGIRERERQRERGRNPYAVAARQHAVVLAARPFSFMISRGAMLAPSLPPCVPPARPPLSPLPPLLPLPLSHPPPSRFQRCRPTMLRDVHIRAQVLLFLLATGGTGKSPKAKRYNQNRARDPALRCLILLELDRFRFSSLHFFFSPLYLLILLF